MRNNIILGTANFTQAYGVLSHQALKTVDVRHILEAALAGGINVLDTAFGYGHLAQDALKDLVEKCTINTKFGTHDDWDNVLAYLKSWPAKSIDVFMLHDPQNLDRIKGRNLAKRLCDLKAVGAIRRIGVSVYELDEVKAFSSRVCMPDVIQLPLNPLNHTFDEEHFLAYIKKNEIEIHARSLFLQGVLLTKELPQKLLGLKTAFDKMGRVFSRYPSRLCALLTWAGQQPWVDRWVMGVASPQNMVDILSLWGQRYEEPIHFDRMTHALADPRSWNR